MNTTECGNRLDEVGGIVFVHLKLNEKVYIVETEDEKQKERKNAILLQDTKKAE